jgi:hypothetical protein
VAELRGRKDAWWCVEASAKGLGGDRRAPGDQILFHRFEAVRQPAGEKGACSTQVIVNGRSLEGMKWRRHVLHVGSDQSKNRPRVGAQY